jgi:phosphate transport system protein
MSRIIDSGLEELSAMLSRLGNASFEAVSLALRNCLTGSDDYDRIRDLSEAITSMAGETENKAFELIARFQPVASDLRVIKSYMKISNDFARYGRYALDISQVCKRMGSLHKCEDWISDYIGKMSEKVLEMLQISIKALRKHDAELARSISNIEKEVDEAYFGFLDRLVKKASATSKCTIAGVLVVRYIERIADHAVYICESLVYVASGEKVSLG